VQTSHSQPIIGTPTEVPVPRNVMAKSFMDCVENLRGALHSQTRTRLP
jgi:hypothetical protein